MAVIDRNLFTVLSMKRSLTQITQLSTIDLNAIDTYQIKLIICLWALPTLLNLCLLFPTLIGDFNHPIFLERRA
jgi:hypothetical protein